MSDVFLFQTDDDGDISVVGGIIELSAGLDSAAYLSLFGGNEDDDGRLDNALQYWGNLDEQDPAFHARSETQHIIEALPATSGNLRRLEDAAGRDLAWMVEKKAASSVAVVASIPALNRVNLAVTITADGEEFRFNYSANWKASV